MFASISCRGRQVIDGFTEVSLVFMQRSYSSLSKSEKLELKSSLLNSDIVRDYERAHRQAWLSNNAEFLGSFIDSHGYLAFQACMAISVSHRKKVSRVFEKITDIVLSDTAVFLTLTFTDEVLASTSAETRRRYVSRFLKASSAVYVANVDYGDQTEREHYHACVCGRVNRSLWKYGFVFAEKVRCRSGDCKAVSKYVAKLSLHAIKDSCRNTRLIYSRG